jgi:hypothetical protein
MTNLTQVVRESKEDVVNKTSLGTGPVLADMYTAHGRQSDYTF